LSNRLPQSPSRAQRVAVRIGRLKSRRFETNTVVRPGYDKAVGHELHGKGFSFVAQQRNLAVSASQRARDFPKSTKNLFGSFANNSQRNWITAIRYKML